MPTEVAYDVSSGNVRRLATARAPSNGSNMRRHDVTQPMQTLPRRKLQSKKPSAADLLKQITELDESKRKLETAKKVEAKQRQKEMTSAKKKMAKEIREAQQAVRKSEQDIGKLTKQAARVDQFSDLERTKYNRQMQKIDQDMQKLQSKQKTLSDALQAKTAALGEARGKLAHMEFTASLLELGVVADTKFLEKGGLKNGNGVTTICPIVYAAVEPGSQNLQSTVANIYPIEKERSEASLAHVESFEVASSEAISTNDSSGMVPDPEDSSSIFNGSFPVVNSAKIKTLDGALIGIARGHGAVEPAVEGHEDADATPNTTSLQDSPSKVIEHTTIYAPKSIGRCASAVDLNLNALEIAKRKPTFAHQVIAGAPEALAFTTPSMQVAPSSIEDTAMMSLSTVLTTEETARYKHEVAPLSSCRIQNVAYNRSAHVHNSKPIYRPSTPWSQRDNVHVRNSRRNMSVTTPCRRIPRQTSVESLSATPMIVSPDMTRYARSASVLPYGVTSSNLSFVTPSPAWTLEDVGLQGSAAERAHVGARFASSPAIRYEPVVAPPATASPKGYS